MIGRIVFIAPDKNLADKAKQAIYELGEQIEVYQGSLGKGLEFAKNAVGSGANIVISRGGTGELIKKELSIPVVNVETGAYDIINSINEAASYSNNIGIVGFENLVNAYEKIKGIMQNVFKVKITTYILQNDVDVDSRITQLYKCGIRVFIGGQAIISATKRLGYQGVLIESGKETIVEAIKHTKNVLDVQLREKEKAEILKSIIDFAYDGVLGVDKNGLITVFNPVTEKLVGIQAEKAIGRPVDEVVENTRMDHVLRTGEAELGEIQQLGENSIVTNRVPIIVDGEVLGVVATFQELEKIQKMESKIRKKLLNKGHIAKATFKDIIGNSDAIKLAKDKAKQYAEVESTVLIFGETGTGKELFAQSIHNASNRNEKPFVAVNCAALPENLLESELFGYVEGAFTGARKGGKAGLFELAHEGTIFLDEISEMSSMIQARFLRVLQEKEVVRLGDDKVIPVNVRIIAATNRELHNQVKKNEFREDLYYRLCVLNLQIPPLRERKEDIPNLADFFIKDKENKMGKNGIKITSDVLIKLVNYTWPGNVRHLENVVERLLVLCKGKIIDKNILSEVMEGVPEFFDQDNEIKIISHEDDKLLKQIEAEMIKKVLEENKGNRTLAAKELGISITTLWRRMKKIEKNDK